MKKLLAWTLSVVVFLVFAPTLVQAERVTASRPNAVSFELFGRALLYSLNYDRLITEKIGVGAGAGPTLTGFLFPIYGNYYFYSRENSRGFGTGGIDIFASTPKAGGFAFSKEEAMATIGGGYEERGNKGLMFRAAAYLLIPIQNIGKLLPWFGFSVGYAF